MKKGLFFVITIFLMTTLNVHAQFKIHQNGHVSFQSQTTQNGVQIDSIGRCSLEPNISSSYYRIIQTKVHSNNAKNWIVKYANPFISTDDVFYVLGMGDIYGGSHYIISNGGSGNVSKESHPIDNASEILTGLTGYYYDNHEFDGFVPDYEGNPEINPEAIPGLLKDLEIDKVSALDPSELEEVFPEAIRHDPRGGPITK